MTGGQRLPPLVLYNGETRWSAPVDLRSLLTPVPPALACYQPPAILSLAIALEADATAVPFPSPPAPLPQGRGEPEDERPCFGAPGTPDQAPLPRGGEGLGRGGPRRSGEPLTLRTQIWKRVKEWTEQWEAEGRAKGLAEGRKDGEVAVLLRQIERKFGSVPATARERIEQASAEEVLELTDRILVASSIEELLGPH